jgi:starvation-inducible outer membrane lipoprotein
MVATRAVASAVAVMVVIAPALLVAALVVTPAALREWLTTPPPTAPKATIATPPINIHTRELRFGGGVIAACDTLAP